MTPASDALGAMHEHEIDHHHEPQQPRPPQIQRKHTEQAQPEPEPESPAAATAQPQTSAPALDQTDVGGFSETGNSSVASPVPAPDHHPSKLYRASSRRASFGRPTPPLRTLKTNSNDGITDSVTRSSTGYSSRIKLGQLVGRIQEWIDEEKASLENRPNSVDNKLDFQLSLARLQQILHQNVDSNDDSQPERCPVTGEAAPLSEIGEQWRPVAKRSSLYLRKLGRAPSHGSDTDNDVERHPPSVEAVLDNSKTMSYSAPIGSQTGRRGTSSNAWQTFRTEILKLTHTLKLKGWRRVPLEYGSDVEVQRLSGALTNAVYVVSPPKTLSKPGGNDSVVRRPAPNKLLLRIYGPQVEHLIDRQSELAILRRLARKNIGPKLLGTFTNGRFEEYFHATTLTANDIRDPSFSRQISKRMRELHEGVSLLPEERAAGPFVWQNWDKWKERCEEVIEWLDDEIKAQGDVSSIKFKGDDAWRGRGFVCGAEWKVFRAAVRAYRTWLENQYGGHMEVLDSLIFAHNDTQYGNLLRLMPDDKESPLLRPANEYRRLVVIDFEYANANTRGYEFANHFTEWCYNYHSNEPHACVTDAYPSREEQIRFIRAYINHVPHFQTQTHTPGSTPKLNATASPSVGASSSPLVKPALRGSVSSFMLDSRAPPGGMNGTYLSSSVNSQSGKYMVNKSYEEEEKAREEAEENETTRLLNETRLWRMANSAQWVAWGIVQAKVPGMEEALAARRVERGNGKVVKPLIHDTATEPKILDQLEEEPQTISGTGNGNGNGFVEEGAEDEEEEEEVIEEFDNLAYAQDRALFFWGDILNLGLVREEDLPPELVAKAKRIDR